MRKITSKREYREVYNDNYRISGSLFIFLLKKELSDLPEESCAIGIVVSKKVGNAVIRNKSKRRVRAFLRENEDLLPKCCQLVIIAKSKAGTATWSRIEADLTKLFKSIR
ncbi:MAG: ribonuclease P protein component [Candidatus Cloacimonadales bacterium]